MRLKEKRSLPCSALLMLSLKKTAQQKLHTQKLSFNTTKLYMFFIDKLWCCLKNDKYKELPLPDVIPIKA
jgi:hypothetical protein